ncbi:YfjI family protein [Pseudomonas paralcaligenes]|uniref:YfjI family protein n=1 Tax=Pseudomonas paralcaligenes TaxID=2772558 RepID=UPI0021CE3FBB|nr:YfjI family protein [Pseudomonas paralcaligenes]
MKMSTPIISRPKYVEPIPLLIEKEEDKPYPVDALGELLGGAVAAIASAVQVPDALAAQSILTAAAMASQPHANVLRAGQRIPLSLFGLTVAESGDRKSSADRLALHAHREHQQILKRRQKVAEKEFRNLRDAYQKAHSIVLDRTKHEKPEVVATELTKLNEPTEPKLPIILVEEPTIEGLQKSLLRGHSSQGFFSDEGGLFFGGHATKSENILKSFAGLSKLWDGAPITRTRAADGESATRSGCRLSAHLMIQPIVAQDILNNPILLGQGLLARFLISWPQSLAGTRLYQDIDATSDHRLINFWKRMSSLLETPAKHDENDELSAPDLKLEIPAQSAWIRYHDEIEKTLGRGGEMQEIKSTAAKSAENALRIAGVIAVTEGLSIITKEIMERAAILSRWYLNEAHRLAYPTKIEMRLLNAQQLLDWLTAKCWVSFDARRLQREGPMLVRKSSKQRDQLLAILVEHCFLSTTDGKEYHLAKSMRPQTFSTIQSR